MASRKGCREALCSRKSRQLCRSWSMVVESTRRQEDLVVGLRRELGKVVGECLRVKEVERSWRRGCSLRLAATTSGGRPPTILRCCL